MSDSNFTPSVSFLAEHIERAARSFAKDELAFLALTSKVERPFLDRLSYWAFVALRESRYTVTREWPVPRGGRADLVFLEGVRPACIVEAKAMMSFDCAREGPMQREYADALQFDLGRYVNVDLPDTDIYCLLLSSCPLSPIPQRFAGVLKYVAAFERAFRRFGTAADICAVAEENLLNLVRRDAISASGTLAGGSAFAVSVELRWWLFGPFRPPSDLRILSGPVRRTARSTAMQIDNTRRKHNR